MNYKRGQLSDAVTPLVCALICAGIGYGAWKLEKWTDTSENSNSQKQGNENKDELLHSNAGMQSK